MVSELLLVVVISIISQSLVEQIKKLFKIKKGWWYGINLKVLMAVVVSLVMCLAYNVDLMVLLGFEAIPYLGAFITGLIVSGGSVYVHELLKQLQQSKGEEK